MSLVRRRYEGGGLNNSLDLGRLPLTFIELKRKDYKVKETGLYGSSIG